MGDLNNDKLNDLVTVNNAQTQFLIHYFSSDTMKFQTATPLSVTGCPIINAISIGTEVAGANGQHLENLIFVCEDSATNTTLLRVMKQQLVDGGNPTFVDSTDPINNLQIYQGS